MYQEKGASNNQLYISFINYPVKGITHADHQSQLITGHAWMCRTDICSMQRYLGPQVKMNFPTKRKEDANHVLEQGQGRSRMYKKRLVLNGPREKLHSRSVCLSFSSMKKSDNTKYIPPASARAWETRAFGSAHHRNKVRATKWKIDFTESRPHATRALTLEYRKWDKKTHAGRLRLNQSS